MYLISDSAIVVEVCPSKDIKCLMKTIYHPMKRLSFHLYSMPKKQDMFCFIDEKTMVT